MNGINTKNGLLITGNSTVIRCNQCNRALGREMERKVDFFYSNGRFQCLECLKKATTQTKRVRALKKARKAKEGAPKKRRSFAVKN